MRSMHVILVLVLLGAVWFAAAEVPAQQVTIGTPFNTLNDSFFERTGVSWSGNWKGLNFSFGGGDLAVPPFGNYKPGAGLTTGFGIRSPNFNANFNIFAEQGSQRSNVSQTPSVTLMNGQQAFISDVEQRPFVMGMNPVVGGFRGGYGYPSGYGYPMAGYGYPGYSMGRPTFVMSPNPRVQAMRRQLAERNRADSNLRRLAAAAAGAPKRRAKDDDSNLVEPAPAAPAGPAQRLATARSSSAGRAVPSVAEARRLHAKEQGSRNGEVMALFERGRTAEEDGKPGVAKVYYRMVVRRATGELREQAQARLTALRGDR